MSIKFFQIGTLVFFCFLFSTYRLFANSETKSDSLLNLLQIQNTTEQKVKIYNALLFELRKTNDPRIIEYANQLIDLSEKEDILIEKARGLSNRGLYQSKMGMSDSALKDFKQAIEIYKQEGNFVSAVSAAMNIYFIYRREGKTDLQEKVLDEIEVLANKARDAESLGNFYRAKAMFVKKTGTIDETMHYYDLAIEKFEELDDFLNLAIILQSKGQALLDALRPNEALPLLNKAQLYARKTGDSFLEIHIINSKSGAFQMQGLYLDAVKTGIESLSIAETTNAPSPIASGNLRLGDLYAEIGDTQQAQTYYKKAISITEENHFSDALMDANQSLGLVYFLDENYEEAIPYLEKSLFIADTIRDEETKLTCINDLTVAYLNIGEIEKGKLLMKQATELCAKNNLAGLAEIDRSKSIYFLLIKDYRKAIEYATKHYSFVKKNSINSGQISSSFILYEANKALNVDSNTIKWLEINTELKKSEMNQVTIRNITTQKLNADFEKKEIKLLAEQEKQEVLLEAKAERNLLAAGGIGALALLAFGFFYNARRNNQKIATQNVVISEKNKQLEQVNQTKDRIFAIIGHDLRKPVVAFSGISETINYLIKKEDYATLQQLGGEIEKDGFALQKLTDNLLNWALTQRDVMPYNPQEIKLSEKAEEILLIFEKVARDKNIDLINKVPKDLNIFADPTSLLTILINLIDNALKYTPSGGRVEINALTNTDGTRLEIIDTGVGIPKEQLNDIFLLQKDKSKKGTGGEKGTGLGLHLVNELVKLNHGEITAESREGKGTIFRVLLPTKKLKTA